MSTKRTDEVNAPGKLFADLVDRSGRENAIDYDRWLVVHKSPSCAYAKGSDSARDGLNQVLTVSQAFLMIGDVAGIENAFVGLLQLLVRTISDLAMVETLQVVDGIADLTLKLTINEATRGMGSFRDCINEKALDAIRCRNRWQEIESRRAEAEHSLLQWALVASRQIFGCSPRLVGQAVDETQEPTLRWRTRCECAEGDGEEEIE